MADINQTNWSEIDALNNTAPPNGWPTGMFPNETEATARAVMGAVRRFYDHINATVTSTGLPNAQMLTYPQGPTAVVAGDVYRFVVGPGLSNTSAMTLSVNGLGPFPFEASGAPFIGGEVLSGSIVEVVFDGTAFELTGGGASLRDIQGTPGQIAISGPSNDRIIGFDATPTSTGSPNAQVIAYSATPPAFDLGDQLTFLVGNNLTNTGAMTLAVNTLGPFALNMAGQALVGGEIQAGAIASVIFGGTAFELFNAGQSVAAISGTATEIVVSGSLSRPVISLDPTLVAFLKTLGWTGS